MLSVHSNNLDMDAAFAHNQHLSNLARAVADGTADIAEILAHHG